jgi:8-oxo-dGTP pyrophosphatase MutT (NUDIX family)
MFRLLSERPVHDGYVWRVVVGEFQGPDGARFTRDIVRSPGAVGVVPVHHDGTVVLVRQYRATIDDWVLEIPAGMRDVPGEEPAATAQRELAEEVGLQAASLELLTVMLGNVGMSDSRTHVYLGQGLRAVERQAHGPEEQAMELVTVALAEALAAVEAGTITDAKTVVGLLLAARRLGS